MKKLTKKEKENQEYIQKEFEFLTIMFDISDYTLTGTLTVTFKNKSKEYDLSKMDDLKSYYFNECVLYAENSGVDDKWYDKQVERIRRFIELFISVKTKSFHGMDIISELVAEAIRHDIELEEQKPY